MPNPFAHIELTTDNLKAAQKFYSKVFAWKLSEMPGMNYTMIDVGTGTGGGMQSKPMPDAPTGWVPYVQVDDVKATIAKATKAGATAMLPYMDIGDMGAIGVFADPNGAMIGVWESKRAPAEAPAPEEPPPAATKKADVKPKPAKKAEPKQAPAAAAKAPAKKALAAAAKAPAKQAPSAVAKAPAKNAPAPAKKGLAAKKAPAPAEKPAPAKKKKG